MQRNSQCRGRQWITMGRTANQSTSADTAGWQLRSHTTKTICIASRRMFRPFCIRQIKPTAAMEQEIGLLCAIAPEVDLPTASPVDLAPADLPEHQCFPQGPGQWRCRKICGGPNPAEERAKPAVPQVQFWRLHERFCTVGKPGFQKNDFTGGLQHGQPGRRSRTADSHIAGKIGAVQHLCCTQRTRPEKALVIAQLSHTQQLTEIPFQIGCHIGMIITIGFDFRTGMQFGESPAQKKLLDSQ